MAEATTRTGRTGPFALALRAVVTLALVAGTALVARVPLGEPSPQAALRIALRTAQGRIEICRVPSAEETAALPAHMRAQRICEETAVDFRLRVAVDGETRLERVLAPGGVRRTRPLAVDAQIPVEPGRRRLSIAFDPLPPDPPLGADAAAAFDRLARLELDTQLELAPGRVVLVTLGADGRLRVSGAAGAPAQGDAGGAVPPAPRSSPK